MSNIITPAEMNQPKSAAPVILSKVRANELVACMQQLRTLHGKSILEAGDEEQKVALTQALATGLLTHVDELLGCWFAVQEEYQPLTLAVASVLRRANAINSNLAAQAQLRRTSNELKSEGEIK